MKLPHKKTLTEKLNGLVGTPEISLINERAEDLHWNDMEKSEREELLKMSGLPKFVAKDDWDGLDRRAKELLGKTVSKTTNKEFSLVEAVVVPLTSKGQGTSRVDTHPNRKDGKIERMYQAKDKNEYASLITAADTSRKGNKAYSVQGSEKNKTVTVVFDDDKQRIAYEKKMKIKGAGPRNRRESVELDEAKHDQRAADKALIGAMKVVDPKAKWKMVKTDPSRFGLDVEIASQKMAKYDDWTLMTWSDGELMWVWYDHPNGEGSIPEREFKRKGFLKDMMKESVELLDEGLVLASDDLNAVKKTAQKLAKQSPDLTYYVVKHNERYMKGMKYAYYEVYQSVDMHLVRGKAKKVAGYGAKVDMRESVEEAKKYKPSKITRPGRKGGMPTGADRGDDSKPLMMWLDKLEKELAKKRKSYDDVNPDDAIKLYYRDEDPKKAAKDLLSGKKIKESINEEEIIIFEFSVIQDASDYSIALHKANIRHRKNGLKIKVMDAGSEAISLAKKYNGRPSFGEDAPANSTGSGVSGMTSTTVGVDPKDAGKSGDIQRRESMGEGIESTIKSYKNQRHKKLLDSIEGCPVFRVSSSEFSKFSGTKGRKRFSKWIGSFREDSPSGSAVKKYSLRNPRKPVIIQDDQSGEIMYLRRRNNDRRLKHNKKRDKNDI